MDAETQVWLQKANVSLGKLGKSASSAFLESQLQKVLGLDNLTALQIAAKAANLTLEQYINSTQDPPIP